MGSKKTTSNDILVKVDQNNLIYIDPNTVLSNGVIQQRQIEPENLVMYVNLEADLVPRTILISGNETNTLTSIAKGTLNFLQNKNGKDFDTTWTDAYTTIEESKNKDGKGTGVFSQSDSSGQNFGIESVDIKVAGANFIPQVSIRFIDVRGKTLFESPENSPYKAFFHLPWPIYYLTVKGYYGKAIKYRLHMVSFTSKYNASNGNFEIDTKFVGSTYAYLNDISLDAILDAPYMYAIEGTQGPSGATYNEQTGYHELKLKKSSKGYEVLTSVYNEYKQKGLLPKNFPVKTLREIVVIAKRLNKILEAQIFSKVIDPKVLAGIKEFSDLLNGFEDAINAWKTKHLSGEKTNGLYYQSGEGKNSLKFLTGSTIDGTLEFLIKQYSDKIVGNQAFGTSRDNKIPLRDKLPIVPISFNNLQKIEDFYSSSGSTVLVNLDKLILETNNIRVIFDKQQKTIIDEIERKMNDIVSKDPKGIGFEPTIRNIIGVVLANADTYVRLMKEVHTKAFSRAEDRKKILKNISTDSFPNDAIYPWPEIKKTAEGEKQNILVYPASLDMVRKLDSDNASLWPEIEFIEEFFSVATKKSDPLTEKEGTAEEVNYVFEDTGVKTDGKNISTLTYLTGLSPYYDKSISSILYEIWERAKYITTIDSFNFESLKELALLEFTNISDNISQDYDNIEILKTITSPRDLQDKMIGFSPFERYPYYQDQLPTVPYLIDALTNDFRVEKYVKTTNTSNQEDGFTNLIQNLKNYVSEDYRTRIYPFSSPTYLDYLKISGFTKTQLDLGGMLGLKTNDAFISSPIDTNMWVKKDSFKTNLFTNTFSVDGQYKHILNTPYFHKQLLEDFNNEQIVGKYTDSAYLLLNSLPFKDLDEYVKYEGKTVLMSSMFREVSASHFIPYHLMLKWGSIYHRYKTYLLDGTDNITGVTTPINGNLYFDNYSGRTYNFTIDEEPFGPTPYSVVRTTGSTHNNIGLNPFYHNIFHQIVNGYAFYDQPAMSGTTSYSNTISNNATKTYYKSMIGGLAWTSFIDNSKFDDIDKRFTLLPSNGYKNYDNISEFYNDEQENYRVIWNDTYDTVAPIYSGETFPKYNQYFKDINNIYTLSDNNNKVIDLIGTFSPEILDIFEQAFIDFSTETINEEIPYKPYDVSFSSFQSLLKGIVSVNKDTNDSTDIAQLISAIISRQEQGLKDITTKILSPDNIIKLTLGNPKEIDSYLLGGLTNTDVQTFYAGAFDEGQIVQENLDLIELYLGEDPYPYLYQKFFRTFDILLNEENIKRFRFLIYVYAGYVNSGLTDNAEAFRKYLVDNIINKNSGFSPITATPTGSFDVGGNAQRLSDFLGILISRFPTLEMPKNKKTLTISRGFNDDIIKLEQYNFFKSFNDKWVAGNSIGQRTLMEEFLFLDKANKDIGDKFFLDMERLVSIIEQRNKNKLNLYTLINVIIKDTGFDMRALPAYVNFYGTNFNNNGRTTPSKSVAKNIFGTFLEVDTQDSMPKIILQYVGSNSKHLNRKDIDKNAKFPDDSFDISNVNNNPLAVVGPDVFRNTDFSKSNKVVAFEVSFGDQNQSIFKGLELDQTSIKNTSESFHVIERLGNSETGSSVAQIDIGLFDIYRQASYTCGVTTMGNVMIQPTMFFYLKNVPLFRGSYWITEVSHSIKTSGIETTFKGSRIPMQSLPDPSESFLASYRSLFDSITKKAIAKVKDENLRLNSPGNTERVFQDKDGVSFSTDMGKKIISGEQIISQVGIKEYGIPYNGYNDEKYIQLIKFNNNEWLRGVAIEMDSNDYKIDDKMSMSFISRYKDIFGNSTDVLWESIMNKTKELDFYSTKFDHSLSPNTIMREYPYTVFLNPNKPNSPLKIKTSIDIPNMKFTGPVNNGPRLDGYGIAMSSSLMTKLGIFNGDVIYFELRKE
jgi:hypothetical protein